MPDCCAAAECKQSSEQHNVSFFRFPLEPERCKQWVGNCRRPDLQAKTPEYLHRNYKLCSRHFELSLIQKDSELRTVLQDGAIPTIFDFAAKKGNAQNRKRKTQATGNNPVEVKKSKDTPQPDPVDQNVTEDSADNSVEPAPVRQEKDDAATAKAKEILKVHFKETLAFTGFSIVDNASIGSTTKSMGGGAVGPLAVNPVCAEKVDPKDVLRLGEGVMREEIRNSLRLARFFSILLQDKTNIDGKDQIPVFIRSVSSDGFPQKHLLGFLPCDTDSDSLYLSLMSEIRNKWGLRMEHCRGFTYMTTGSLCQKLKEFSCRMLRDFPQVVLAPSDPYAFNMWLIRTLPVLSVQEVVDVVEEVAAILKRSETLMKKLHVKITSAYCHIRGEVDRVKESCQNNWQYGTDAFQTMLDILEPLLNSISEMCTSALSDVDASIVEQLLRLKEKLKNFNFIITLVILKNTLCCVSILNPSLKGIISISSTLQYTISNALKLLTKHLQEIPIFHRKWFSDAVGRAKKLGVAVMLPADTAVQTSPEDYYRETLSKMVLQYLIDEVKRVLGVEMIRILRWLSLVPSYMADHNFSIRKDKVADANLNNLARPDSFYDELGCWEVKWRHASKRRILPTGVFATLKIPDIGFYPNVQSLLRVLGSIPCVNADADVYVQYDMVLDRYHNYMKVVPAEKRQCNMAFVYVNQDVHFNIDDMVQSYVESHPDILQLLSKDDVMEVQASVTENNINDTSKEDLEEPRELVLDMELDRPKTAECLGTDKEVLKSALKAALSAACDSQSRRFQGSPEGEVEYVTKSEMNEVLKVCADVVRDGILSEVGNSFFSLFIDRVVRFGDMDLLPLFLRFVDSFDVMRLELMGFVEANLVTEALCERLFDIVTKEWGLDLKYCRGQAYLGSGEMAYKLKAFACKVQEKNPLAICTHCSCYSFNMWWSRSVPVPSISRALDILEKIVVFFGSSPELEKQLDQVIAVGLRESYEKIHEFQGNFCSSWQEKHDSYDVFSQILEPLLDCLERFHNSTPPAWSLSVINQAKKLLNLIRDFDFIVAIVALKNISSFTRELSAALQKDHVSAASQLCQISGIVATLNRLKTNIKVFHQNWFDEACAIAQNFGMQVKVPESIPCPRDSLLKPGAYYKDAVSIPLVDHIINSVKDHFSDDHKEALNFLSLVPSSVTMSYTFEILKSKPPLYVSDLPDPENFFTELSCWKVKWKTKVVSPTIPDSIFQTLRLPLIQYFANISTLLKIMSVLPSTTLEHCGEVKRHKMFQDYLCSTYAKDRTPCLAMLQVGRNFPRDLDRMVTQCLKVTPKTLEGICLDKETKTLRNSEIKAEDNHNDEEMEVQQVRSTKKLPDFNELKAEGNHTVPIKIEPHQVPMFVPVDVIEQQTKAFDENGHSGDQPSDRLQKLFTVAAKVARKKQLFSHLPNEEQELILQKLGTCQWDLKPLSDRDVLERIVKSLRETILSEVQDSPFFSIITDKVVSLEDKKFVPVFIRYVDSFTPKVALLGFLPLDSNYDGETQAKTLTGVLSGEWGLQMGYCRGQSFMCMGAGGQGLRKLSLGYLESFPLAVNTPSESCGLAYWLAGSLHNDPIAKVLGVVEDLLLFFDQSPRLHVELSQTREGLLNTPREALAEVPETCLSKWKRTEDFFDILVDMLEGVLSCLDSVSNNADSFWSNNMSIHALMLSTAIRESDFVISLVILKNACAPLRNCSTVFRCGNPADIICELEKIPVIIESLVKMLENIGVVHNAWFNEATQLAVKVAGALSYPDTVSSYDSPEEGYRETVSIPVLSGLIEEMKFNFSDCHLKALRVLSLLPTCNPLPVLPDAPDKLYAIYQSDLPEPDVAEDEINAWATVWRDKYQDSSLPTSVSETLRHPEAKAHPNVTMLLRLVAVLPSISMECDLMKTTLTSLRSLIQIDYDSASKTNVAMLLMHCPMLQTLEQVIDRCMELDTQSHGILSLVKETLSGLKPYSVADEVPSEVKINAMSSGVSEILNGMVPVIAPEDQPIEKSSSELDGTTVTPKEINASNGQEESSPVNTDGQSADTGPNKTEMSSSTGSAPDCEYDASEEHTSTVQSVTAELQNGNLELLTQVAKENITSELATVPKHVTMEHLEPVTRAVAVNVFSEPSVAEPVTEAQDASMEVTVVEEVAAQEITVEPVMSGQDVIPVSCTTADVSMEQKEAIPVVLAQDIITKQSLKVESATITEPLSVSEVDPRESMVIDTAWLLGEDKHITVAHKAAGQGVTSVLEVAADSGIKKPDTANVTAEFTVQGVSPKLPSPEVCSVSLDQDMVPQEITKELAAAGQNATTKQGITKKPCVGVPIVTTTQGLAPEPEPTAQGLAPEPEPTTQGLAPEPEPTAQGLAPEPVPTAQGLAPEPEPTAQGLAPEPVPTAQGLAPEPVPTAQGLAPEPEPIAQGLAPEPVPTAQGLAPEPEPIAQGLAPEPVPTAQGLAPEPVPTAQGLAPEPVPTAQGLAPEPVPTAQGLAPEPVPTAQGLAPEPEPTAQGLAPEPVPTAQGLAPEPEPTAQGLAPEPEPTAQGLAPEPEPTAQGLAPEPEPTAQGLAPEPEPMAQGLAPEPVPTAQGLAPEPVPTAQGLAPEPVPTAQGLAPEPVPTAQGLAPEPVPTAQGLAPEPVPTAQGLAPEPVPKAQGLAPEPVPTAQGLAPEPVPTAQGLAPGPVPTAQGLAPGPVPTAQGLAPGPVPTAQGLAPGPEPASQGLAPGPVPASQGLAPGPPVPVSQGLAPETETAAQRVAPEPDATAQGVAPEPDATAQGVAPEPDATAQGVAPEPDATAQGVAPEPDATAQGAAAESDATAQGAAAESDATAQGAAAESDTVAQGVAAESDTVAQVVAAEPDEGEDIPKTQCDTVKPSAQHEASYLADPTKERQKAQANARSDEPTTNQELTVIPLTFVQDTSNETNQDQSIIFEAHNLSRAEVQDSSTEPVPTEVDVTLDVSKEPVVARPDISVQCGVTAEHQISTESVPVAEDVPMDTTEADQYIPLEPHVLAQFVPTEETSEHVPMEVDAKQMTTEPVQDVVMESQDESQGVSMEPITEIQDVPMDPSEDLKAEPQDACLKADVKGVTLQDMEPAQNGMCESRTLAGVDKAVPASDSGAVQTTTDTNDATSSATDVNRTAVPDDQSYAITQDGTDMSKEVAQAAGEVGTEAHKGILSFYSTPPQEAFFSDMQNAKFFSIICEQQIEIEGHTYIPVGVCYLEKCKTPCEDVLAYVPLDQDVGVFVDSLTTALCEKWGLDMALCRGQSLQTVGAAGAQVRSAALLLSQRYPHAMRTFSSSVSLNTWLAKSCIISEIADSFTWVERMLQWVTEDEGNMAVLHKTVTSLFQHDTLKQNSLIDRLGRNQWELSHDTLDLTIELLEAIMLSLNDIKDNHDIQAERTQAGDFLIILQNFEFILTLVIMKNVLGPTKRLSQDLHSRALDVYQAVNSLPDVLSSLSDIKSNIDAHLQIWYQEAVGFASKLQISIDHTSQECLIIYCRDIISRGAIDHSICEISELFSERGLSAVRCMQVVPYVMSKTEGCCMDSDVFKVYQGDLPDQSSLPAELLKWREKWLDADATQQKPLPDGLLDTLDATDASSFPNIETLLRLLVVLPCFRKEDLIRQGKKSLIEFNQQRSLLELYPL